MRRLHDMFPDELVIIGVHSGKFPAEHSTANIRSAVLRHGLHHPVVNDPDLTVWQSFAVRAWPTVLLIDPAGNYVGMQAGEIKAEYIAPSIRSLIDAFDLLGKMRRDPTPEHPEAAREPLRLLDFPANVLATNDQRLFIADTGHHRILELRLNKEGTGGSLIRAFGSGQAALVDGPPNVAAFQRPHGMALSGTTLYIADTDNHALRAIDLASGNVRTVAGTGEKSHGRIVPGKPLETALRSPWAIWAEPGVVFIAMAGSHQVWVLVRESELGIFAGTGYEALVDGSVAESGFNQPSDVAAGLGHLFVADSEASAIRAITLDASPQVVTLVGQGLFVFGDQDGYGADVRMQHPTGLAVDGEYLYIADSYNHKIKRLDPSTGFVQTIVGSGQPGAIDGPARNAQLFEPEGISISNQRLFIADTNNHLIRVADLAAQTVTTLAIHNPERLYPHGRQYAAAVRLPPTTVAPGLVSVRVRVNLPPEYKLNFAAPVTLHETGSTVPPARIAGTVPSITTKITADRELELDLLLFYCEAGDERLCMIHDAHLIIPVQIVPQGTRLIDISYSVNQDQQPIHLLE
ncbi:MAG: thioredoxin-like domain-containing protein [Herpetosiphon sp.]